MRILVISDSHGDMAAIDRVISQAGDFDRVFHLGDNYRDARYIEDITAKPVDKVPGNCDFVDAPSVITVCVGGKRFFLAHGHNHGVGYSTVRLTYAADEAEADVALFGHTHHSMIDYVGRLTVMNPGSISRPRGCAASYGIIEIDHNGVMRADICPVKI